MSSWQGVNHSFFSQLGRNREEGTSKWLLQTGLRASLGSIFLFNNWWWRTQSIVGSAIPGQMVLHCVRKQSEPWGPSQSSMLLCDLCFSSSLSDGPWRGCDVDVTWIWKPNKSFPPSRWFGDQKANKTHSYRFLVHVFIIVKVYTKLYAEHQRARDPKALVKMVSLREHSSTRELR